MTENKYWQRALHNTETACKKSYFGSQLGGKAQFMNNK